MSDKIDDEDLLDILQSKESSAAHYIHGTLGSQRETALREYYRMPYGSEEEGWSSIVASDGMDSVEWILAAIMKVFASTDKAVQFEPSTQADVKAAEQATDACNHVFYKQNNGFLVLYTAIKDMLTVRNCAVMWRKETNETVSSVPFKGASEEMLALMLQEEDAEIEQARPAPVLDQQGQPMIDPMTGQPVMGYDGRLKKTEKRTTVKVEAFSPEDLLIERDWTSPLLQECPYVGRLIRVTLSDLKNMGFKDVSAEDLKASQQIGMGADADFRLSRVNQADASYVNHVGDSDSDDDAMAEGWLRMEWILVDADGDGIAERLQVYRLHQKILSKEVVSQVPVATSSPILNTHRWDGMSYMDVVSDLQKLHTEILRQTLDNLKLTNNPRTKVLTDANWSPLANIDDLLDSRPGGVIRQRDMNAVTEQVTPFAAAASMPMLEYIQGMRENRTGVSRASQGLNPDSLNNTATGRAMDMSAAMQRTEMVVRIIAETLVKPIFLGILKTLTDGGMEKLAFRLRDEFVEYDPNEWRDQYAMTVNVGLGTGDKAQQAAHLTTIYQMQMAGMQMGLATPKHLYHTQAKLVENAGFKDVQNFVQDPTTVPPQPQQPPLPLQIEQMKMQNEAQKFQAQTQAEIQKFQAETQLAKEVEQIKAQAKIQEVQANLELQRSNDERDAAREMAKAEYDAVIAQQKLEFEKWKAEFEAQTKIYIEEMKIRGVPPADYIQEQNNMTQVLQGLQAVIAQMSAPKMIVRDQNGKAIGVQHVNGG